MFLSTSVEAALPLPEIRDESSSSIDACPQEKWLDLLKFPDNPGLVAFVPYVLKRAMRRPLPVDSDLAPVCVTTGLRWERERTYYTAWDWELT